MKYTQRIQIVKCISILLFGVACYLFVDNGEYTTKYRTFIKSPSNPSKIKQTTMSRSDKWIVVTTISHPTDGIKYLTTLKDWKVVVVGDTKTPSNWSYNNCVYLSIADQKQLGFSIAAMLPEKSYTRKNIGYLYAIANGAKVLYETDDDNRPFDKLKQFTYSEETSGLMFAGKIKTFNSYRYFGQSSIWPRGYPLSSIGENFTYSYLLGQWKSPLIQQGLVNGDPDVDAIYRLSRKLTDIPLNISFRKRNSPVFVPSFVFSPFNTQNTLYLYDAFWALFIPSTTSFRVCDIWRSYWAQRLLWEIGGHIGFYPPNAFSKRNPHSYLHDFYEEKQMYFQTEKLLQFLGSWTCHVKFSFFECIIKLTSKMAEYNFLKMNDVTLVTKWISDLKVISYKEPVRVSLYKGTEIRTNVNLRNISRAKPLTDVYDSAVQERPSLITPTDNEYHVDKFKSLENLIEICPDLNLTKLTLINNSQFPKFENILLIVNFNYPFYMNIKIIELLYRKHFPYMVYCGKNITAFEIATRDLNEQVTFIEIDTIKGFFAQRCFTRAIRMKYYVDGYLYIMDDLVLNINHIKDHSLDKIWTHPPKLLFENQTVSEWQWFKGKICLKAYQKSILSLKEDNAIKYEKFKQILMHNTGDKYGFYHGRSDILYLPAGYQEEFLYYMDIFSRNEVFLEIAFPTVIAGIERKENWAFLQGKYIGNKKDKYPDYQNKIKDFLHPVKFRRIMQSADGIRTLCKTLIKPLLFQDSLK